MPERLTPEWPEAYRAFAVLADGLGLGLALINADGAIRNATRSITDLFDGSAVLPPQAAWPVAQCLASREPILGVRCDLQTRAGWRSPMFSCVPVTVAGPPELMRQRC